MIRNNFIQLCFLALLFSTTQAFAAKIALSTVIVDFSTHKQKFYDLSVTNISEDETAYVQITAKEVINPGTNDEKRVVVERGSKNSLIVSPQKLVIPPKGKKSLRFVSLHKDLEKDKIYRVHIAPVAGAVDAKGNNFIKILVAYDALVIIRPKELNNDFEAVRDGRQITFTNKGNTNILFRKAEQCPKDKSLECKKIPGKRLYVDTSFTQELPFDTAVTYTYSVGSKLNTVTY